MSITSLFEAIPAVTTPLALMAFLAAAVVIAQAQAIGRAEALIKAAPEADRKTLVAGALKILNLRAERLTREQRFELALEELEQRKLRSWLVFIASLSFGLLFASLAVYSFVQYYQDPSRAIATLLSGPEKQAAIVELKSRGIFDASDEAMVDFLVSKTAVPREQAQVASEAELVKLASARYEAIPSVKELRLRAEAHQEPFSPIGDIIVATVPEDRDDQPRQFFVHVPKNSRYKWKTIAITNPETHKYIRVLARPAIDDSPRGTDLHLNEEQAIFLNGGRQIPAKAEMVIRETSEPISDPNCSIKLRSSRFLKITKELCEQGKSVELAYLLNTMGR